MKYQKEMKVKSNPENEPTMSIRSTDEIGKRVDELFDKVWYYRKLIAFSLIRAGKEEMFDESLSEKITENMRRIEKKYNLTENWQLSDNEWGYLQGKFAALNWVIGFEDDFTDT
jgi:predicted DNA-binding protein